MNIDDCNLILRMAADAASSGRWSEIPEIIDSLPKDTRFRVTFDLIRDVPDTAEPTAAPMLDGPSAASPASVPLRIACIAVREELGLSELPPNTPSRDD